MKHLFFFLFTSLIFISCTNDDDSTPGNNDQDGLRLLKMETVTNNYNSDDQSTSVVDFEYNSDGKLSSKTETKTSYSGETTVLVTDYEYEDGKLIKIEYDNGDYELYTYENNNIIESYAVGNDNTTTIIMEYSYDEAGLMIQRSITVNGDCCTVDNHEYYEDGNPNYEMYFTEYDDHPTPLLLIHDPSYLKIKKLPLNNILTKMDDVGNTEEYTYTYNSENYPTNYEFDSEANGQYVVREYFYE
ncbi:MAG: hypothetical protein ABR595_10960 [Psychroflexus sp.]